MSKPKNVRELRQFLKGKYFLCTKCDERMDVEHMVDFHMSTPKSVAQDFNSAMGKWVYQVIKREWFEELKAEKARKR